MIPEAKGVTAQDVIAELCERLETAGRLNDRTAFIKAVMAREQLSPTIFPPGWAFPHARLADIPQLSFGMARTSKPIPWVGWGGSGVRLVWLFAVPEGEPKAYLNLIASIAKFSQDASRAEQLTQARDAGAMYAVLEQAPLRHARSHEPVTRARLV